MGCKEEKNLQVCRFMELSQAQVNLLTLYSFLILAITWSPICNSMQMGKSLIQGKELVPGKTKGTVTPTA
uniref:Uncharacterized protein n=1 Tax=Solanum lycopersicum TaxID=4081 RepID=A0A3Q7HLH0_SOLLC